MFTATMPSFIAKLMRPFSLSSSMSLGPSSTAGAIHVPEGCHKATFAAGCFWGVEHMFRKSFIGKGLYDARVGYIGGDSKCPSYRQVCSGRSGHAEAVQLTYDPEEVSYADLVKYFYRMHDPTTHNQQGPDSGSQYRSGIFYHDDEQKRIAEEITHKANEKWWKGKIVTNLVPAGQWWDAEDYHQQYLDNTEGGYECPSHFLRKFPDLY